MRRRRNMSLGVRLGASFALIVALLLVVAFVGLSGGSSQGAAAQKLNAKLRLTQEVMQVKFRDADFNGWQTAYAFDVIRGLKGATADNAGSRKSFLASAAAFRRELAIVQHEPLSSGQRASVAAAASAFDQFTSTDKQVIALYREGTPQGTVKANDLVLGREITLFTQISTAVDRLVSSAATEARQANASAASAQSSSSTLIILTSALAVVFAAAVAFFVVRHIKRYVRLIIERLEIISEKGADRLREGLEALAEGDLTREYPITTTAITEFPGDELGQILRTVEEVRVRLVACFAAYGTTGKNLRAMIGQVAQTAGNVSCSSREMATTSEETGRATGEIAQAVGDVAQGAERQVQMVETAKHAAEEVARAVSESAENAHRVADVAQEARQIAQEGVGAADQANEAMQSVRDSSHAVSDTIRELASKSEQIGAIVQTITGIAEQTNLLALNAAIEAARAGEQGRGFAVVAEEVRKLAEESQHAAHEIAELIGSIQGETTKAVKVVEDGAQRTDESAGVVEQTREAFQRIEASVDDMTGQIEQIAAAAEQIAASANSMQETVADVASVAEESSASTEQVSASTEQTSASAEQIAASAQELSGNAEELNRLVAKFKTAA